MGEKAAARRAKGWGEIVRHRFRFNDGYSGARLELLHLRVQTRKRLPEFQLLAPQSVEEFAVFRSHVV